MNEDGKLYKFGRLRDFLTRSGYQVEKGEPFKPVRIEKVDLRNLRASNVIIKEDGLIYYQDPMTKVERQAFLYKKRFYFKDDKKPKFHLCICETIQQYGEEEYGVSNEGTVVVKDTSNHGRARTVSGLELCYNCRKILSSKYHLPQTSEEMERILREAAEAEVKDIDLDMDGYVKNWKQISTAYRRKMNCTCENCGIHLKGRDMRFMHVHHIDGNKLNNKEDNFQCLCIRCHANVNDHHRERFSSGDRLKQLREFEEKFGNVE